MRAESVMFTITIDNRFLESNALISEHQGMVGENQFCRERGEEPQYIKAHFDEVAKKLRALKTVEEKPAHADNNGMAGAKPPQKPLQVKQFRLPPSCRGQECPVAGGCTCSYGTEQCYDRVRRHFAIPQTLPEIKPAF